MKVELEQQVVGFVGSIAPEPRRTFREALRKLTREEGNIRALEGNLEGYYRLRVGRYRIIFFYRSTPRSRQIRCVFAEHRTLIYEVFAQTLHEHFES